MRKVFVVLFLLSSVFAAAEIIKLPNGQISMSVEELCSFVAAFKERDLLRSSLTTYRVDLGRLQTLALDYEEQHRALQASFDTLDAERDRLQVQLRNTRTWAWSASGLAMAAIATVIIVGVVR